MSLTGLDIGTTGCKAVVFDECGHELCRAYREYPLSHPMPGWVEISPSLIWQNVVEVLRETNSQVGTDPVKAVAVSCQGEAVLPIDKNGNALYNFIITFDSRTQPQCEAWRECFGAENIFAITGMPLHPMYSINKIMWVRENKPEIYLNTLKFLCVEDYIIYRLSGEVATDYSLAARTMAFDVTARDWSDEVLKRADVARELLPSAYPSGTYVGKVGVKVAGEVGFRDGVVVATGGHDQPCGALGAGITQPGMAMNATGTSEVICPAFSRPVLNRNMLAANYCCYPHVSEDSYCSIGFNLTGGLLLRWYRDVLCGEEMAEAKRRSLDPYELILSKMSVDSRDLFIMPHFVGTGTPELNASARGAIWGLTLDTDKSHLTRAVIDSLNYEMKLNIDRMEEAGVQIDELRAIGGGAKSDKWLQMKADVFGKPVASLAVSEAASFGSALLAGKAVGVYESVAEASKRLVRVREVFEPDTARHRDYEQRYRKYVEIRDLFKALRSGLAGF